MVFSPWLGAVELAQGYPDAGEDVPHLVPMQRDQLSFPGRGFSANPPSPLPRGNWTVLHKQDCEFGSQGSVSLETHSWPSTVLCLAKGYYGDMAQKRAQKVLLWGAHTRRRRGRSPRNQKPLGVKFRR